MPFDAEDISRFGRVLLVGSVVALANIAAHDY